MMTCDQPRLKDILFKAIGDETGIAGVPVQIVTRRMKEQFTSLDMSCDDNDINRVIQRALDAWEIDKTLDEVSDQMMREANQPVGSGFIWHLKVLTKERSEIYKSLKPEAKALIRLLREQNSPGHCGEIQKDVAIKELTEQGFSEDDLRHISAPDIIEEFYGDGGSYELVKEYQKTEEYKQWLEEAEEKAWQKEMRRYRFTEECETTDPIHGHLDRLGEKQSEDLEALEMKRETMDEVEYLRKKKAIETKDAVEEAQWKQIIEMVYKLPFDTLIDLRKLLWKELPTPDVVLDFLEKKSNMKEVS
jgi:hypothetical protein